MLVVLDIFADLTTPTNELIDKTNISVEYKPIPMSNRDIAKFNFHAETVNSIGEYFYVPHGYKYLVITYRIKNDGYNVIPTSGAYWKLRANRIYYSYSSATYDESINHIEVSVLNGGDITNKIVFLIPNDVTSVTFCPMFNDDNILIVRDKTLLIPGYIEEYKGYENWVLNGTTKHSYNIN
jgi:hypothetical protein